MLSWLNDRESARFDRGHNFECFAVSLFVFLVVVVFSLCTIRIRVFRIQVRRVSFAAVRQALEDERDAQGRIFVITYLFMRIVFSL